MGSHYDSASLSDSQCDIFQNARETLGEKSISEYMVKLYNQIIQNLDFNFTFLIGLAQNKNSVWLHMNRNCVITITRNYYIQSNFTRFVHRFLCNWAVRLGKITSAVRQDGVSRNNRDSIKGPPLNPSIP